MLSPQFHARKRQEIQQRIQQPILLLGNGLSARNFPANTLPFRQDSNFLYFTGCSLPDAAVLLHDGIEILFLPKQDPSDTLWHGSQPSNQEIAFSLGFSTVKNIEDLETELKNISALSIAISDPNKNQFLSQHLGRPFVFGKQIGDIELIEQIIEMRHQLAPEELEDIRTTAVTTLRAHLIAMKMTTVGSHERIIAADFHHQINLAGLQTAYDSIVTVNGEILHNHHYTNFLNDGQLLLLDGGAESSAGYATDVTRTWPVNGKFSSQQRDAYQAVLQAQEESIAMVRKGVRYRDIHQHASLVLADFLHQEKLLSLPASDAVEMGAHALFFPHGLGHLLGLDVHDMEAFGDLAGYAKGRTRSSQFGTGYLRLDLDLKENMVVTIEPGFYIVPAIFADRKLQDQFGTYINHSQLEKWKNFGGIRIEDDIRCTADMPENLTASIPKSITDLEDIIGCLAE